jgi:diguanylate cyclase (GGDEF)-like protein/PAS domain S-box-containing protein
MTTNKKPKRGSKKAPKKLKKKVGRTGKQQVKTNNAQKSNDGLMDIYQSILYELPEIVYKIDPEGTFTFISKAVRVLGYEPKELIGKHYNKIVHPDDVRCFGRHYVLPKFMGKKTGDTHAPKLFDERRTGERKTKDLEIRLISKNWRREKRNLREFVGLVSALGDVSSTGHYDKEVKTKQKKFLGSLGIIRDITGRKYMEEALRQSEKRYRDIVEKAGIAILIDDVNGKFRYYNEKFAEIFGYEYEELKNQSIETLVHPDDIKKVMRTHRARLDGKNLAPFYEFKGKRKNGSMLHLEVHAVPLIDDDKYIGTRSYLWDISHRKQIEEHLRTQTLQDELTGLHNRRGFVIMAHQQMKMAIRNQEGFWILFADIDKLKLINDKYGHRQGDNALKIVAKIIQASFRTSDIVARIGGDEFAVLAIESHEENEKLMIKRLHDNLRQYNAEHKHRYKPFISIGTVYCEPQHSTSIEELLARADDLMYQDKRNHKA